MGQGLITFAIPYHKDFGLLKIAIESVQKQSVTDWKLLIADNASGDIDTEYLRSLLKDDRIFYTCHPQNIGMVANLNYCLDSARTPLLSILHSDDELCEQYAEHMLMAYKKFPEICLYYCKVKIINREGRAIFSFPDFIKGFLDPAPHSSYELQGEEGATLLAKGNFLFCPTVCFQMSRLGKFRFNVHFKQVPDWDLWFQLLISGQSFLGISSIDYRYRRHANNATVIYTQNNLRFVEELQLLAEYADRFKQVGWFKASRVARSAWIVKLHIIYCAIGEIFSFNIKAAIKKLMLLCVKN